MKAILVGYLLFVIVSALLVFADVARAGSEDEDMDR